MSASPRAARPSAQDPEFGGAQGAGYRVLLADPPWLFRDSLPGEGRGASKHYQCMALDALASFPLPSLAEDAALFLWRVASMQDEALFLARAWGFTPKCEIVWLKRTTMGRRHFGMGRIVRGEHETLLVATRGKPEVKSHAVRSTFEAPVGVHSAKPMAQYTLIEELYAGPYIELFARHCRRGWDAIGDQLPANDNEAKP